MESRTVRIAWACFLGAFIGATVALEVAKYFWWVGLLTGGIVGYLTYDFKEAISAVPKAFKAATAWRLNWIAIWKGACGTFWFLLGIISLMSSFCTAMVLIVLIPTNAISVSISEGVGALFLFFSVVGVVVITVVSWQLIYHKRIAEVVSDPVSRFRRMALMLNPLAFAFWWVPKAAFLAIRGILWLLWTGIANIPKATVAILTFSWRFGRNLFILVHSDFRLLCAIDSMIGVVVGFFCGIPLLGGIAGALLGAVNYEIFSKWILRLAPKPSRN